MTMDYGETAQMYFDGLMAQPILDGITMEQLQQQITDTLREIDKNFSDCYLSSALLTQKLQRFQPLQASALGALSMWDGLFKPTNLGIRTPAKAAMSPWLLTKIDGVADTSTQLEHLVLSSPETTASRVLDPDSSSCCTSDFSGIDLSFHVESQQRSPLSRHSVRASNDSDVSPSGRLSFPYARPSQPLPVSDPEDEALLLDLPHLQPSRRPFLSSDSELDASDTIGLDVRLLPETFQTGTPRQQLDEIYKFVALHPSSFVEIAAMFPMIDQVCIKLILDLLTRKKFLKVYKKDGSIFWKI